jgi:mannose-6-phosphate isomerase-like protein (cupin superfamily)
VVDDTDMVTAPVEGIPALTMASLYATNQSPPPARPPALADTVEVKLAPGLVRWMVIHHEPHATHHATVATTMHHSDTLDFVYVQEGSAELILQDGLHDVGAGDCVVMTGVDHAWKAGAGGCRLMVVSIGTPPPTS